jgi:hypothetical protein
MARVPMRVVYWGRWADSAGNVGPFSATAVGWIEGGSHALLPGGVGMQRVGIGAAKPVKLTEVATDIGNVQREEKYSVAVLDAQFASLQGREPVRVSLPGPANAEMKELEDQAA